MKFFSFFQPKKRGSGSDWTIVFLLTVAAAIVFIIILGTLWAFASGRARPGSTAAATVSESQEDSLPGSTALFSDIGILRAATADKPPYTVVLSPYLLYPAGDLAFREELVQKKQAMRAAVLAWFAARKAESLERTAEEEVKAALLDEINKLLVLGKIEKLFMEDFLILR